MIKNKMTISWLKRLFICTGVALLLFAVGCNGKKEASKPTIVNVPADEMVNIPWNEGWSPAISVTKGIPIELNGNSEVVYEISSESNYLCVENEGWLKSMSKEESTRKAGDLFYWNPLCAGHLEQLENIDTTWVNIVQKQDGYTTGLVLLKIYNDQKGQENNLVRFKADIFSLSFPLQDGLYQSISNDDLKDIEASYKKNNE